MKIASFKDSSVLRKFTILFIVMSVIPIAVLYYFYLQIKDGGRLEITEDSFNFTLSLIVLGVAVGYFAMRSVIKELIRMTKTSTQAIKNVLGPGEVYNLKEAEDEISVLTNSFNLVIGRLKDNIKNLELAKKTLHSVLSKVGGGIASMENIDNFLDLIVETVTESLASPVGILLLTDEVRDCLVIKSIYGAAIDHKEDYCLKFHQGSFEAAIKAKKPVILDDFDNTDLPLAIRELLFKAPLLCGPLLLHDKILGMIVISRRNINEPFDTDELNLLNNIALQTAVAIENSRLNQDAEKTYFETVSALALAVEAKDVYSRGHLDRVAEYAIKIAEKLNLDEKDLTMLRDAARLHDIGKIGIYDDVLKKPGRLTPEERKMINKHPEIGESIIKPIHSLRPLCDIIRHHHEFLDGTGYPDALKDDEVSLMARILTVADIYDAITSDRPYRKASSKEEAKKILEEMGKKLDQGIVQALFKAMEKA